MPEANLIGTILDQAPVVPVILIDDVADAVPLAKALVAGGVHVLEVTLRTEAALSAAFAVSPGATPTLLDAAASSPVPLLPGTATASEVMAVVERGYTYMKLFPAEAVGGAALLSSLASPLPTARFCPTGGIDPDKAKRYLALPNVVCVGESWLAPRDAIRQGAWGRITELARATLGFKPERIA